MLGCAVFPCPSPAWVLLQLHLLTLGLGLDSALSGLSYQPPMVTSGSLLPSLLLHRVLVLSHGAQSRSSMSEWAAQPEVGPTGSVDARWEVTWGRVVRECPSSPAHPLPRSCSLPSPPDSPRCSGSCFPLFRILQKPFIQEQLRKAAVVCIPKGEMALLQGLLALGRVRKRAGVCVSVDT